MSLLFLVFYYWLVTYCGRQLLRTLPTYLYLCVSFSRKLNVFKFCYHSVSSRRDYFRPLVLTRSLNFAGMKLTKFRIIDVIPLNHPHPHLKPHLYPLFSCLDSSCLCLTIASITTFMEIICCAWLMTLIQR